MGGGVFVAAHDVVGGGEDDSFDCGCIVFVILFHLLDVLIK